MLDVQLAVGFGASIILLIMVYVLMRRFPGVTRSGVDATGILPSMWLAYKRPQLQSLFLQVIEPTADNLRTMGMIEVQLVDNRLPSVPELNNIEELMPLSGSSDL